MQEQLDEFRRDFPMVNRISAKKPNKVVSLIVFVARRLPPGLLVGSVKPGDGRSVAGLIGRRMLAILRSKDVNIPHGPAAGIRFNAGGSAPSFSLGTSEPEVQDVLTRLLKPGDVFYDVGANVGFYTVLASKLVGAHGRVYAFEPVPDNVRAIERNIELSRAANVTVIRCAVTNGSGVLDMTLSAEPFWARLSTLPPPPHPVGRIQVVGVSIDELLAAESIMPPDVIKVDVEGSEEHVLAGMRKALATHRPAIVCELHDTWADVQPLLAAANYRTRFLWRCVRGKQQKSRHVLALPPPTTLLLQP